MEPVLVPVRCWHIEHAKTSFSGSNEIKSNHTAILQWQTNAERERESRFKSEWRTAFGRFRNGGIVAQSKNTSADFPIHCTETARAKKRGISAIRRACQQARRFFSEKQRAISLLFLGLCFPALKRVSLNSERERF